jgi:(p)ppGpp synthase/HD superfamily hydrolase
MPDTLLHRAEQFATRAHAGQPGKIDHCRRVAARCRSEEAKVVAWLHDTVEDGTPWREVLHEFGAEIARRVIWLTRSGKEDYFFRVSIAANDPITREVKIADLRDNMDLSRLPYITMADLRRQARYAKALRILLQ